MHSSCSLLQLSSIFLSLENSSRNFLSNIYAEILYVPYCILHFVLHMFNYDECLLRYSPGEMRGLTISRIITSKVRCEGGDQSGDQSKETGANARQEDSGEQNGRQKLRVHLR
jgi:hypothetical protein